MTMAASDEPSYDRMDIFPSSRSHPRRSALCHDVMVVVIGVVAIVALVFSAIALSRPGTTKVQLDGVATGSSLAKDDKIWIFAIGHDGTNVEYFDKTTGTLRGFHVDIVDAVCQMADKNCRLMWDAYDNCYTSDEGELPRPGQGLIGRWYDACTGWFATPERSASVSFTTAFRKPLSGVFFVKKGNPRGFDESNISGKKIAFIDGSATSEFCLYRAGYTEEQLTPDQIFHFKSKKSLVNAVNNNLVDAAFSNTQFFNLDEDLQIVGDPITNCMKGGAGMMVRKDSRLPDWWNPAFEQLKLSSEYQRICDRVTEVHDTSEKGVDCVD
ncbi:uncharacterized protein LOC110983787 [Acanthaster planci]|uniref:Uncharacterized protein LOC110983787 n=1 Tax=Acanthaster planci TaxID=133434 RepID=A0A8B7Z2P3_ACAPL|nr:uncharacterized protein LOC110983787 [Acanthaster planci]